MKLRGHFLTAIAALATSSLASAQSTEREPATAGGRSVDVPPAQIDESLTIGGDVIEADKRDSRLTVEVMVNGSGPYRFVVDSGADTSVIGEGLAGKLALPEGPRAYLHGITESKFVETVQVESLGLGPTETLNLELPVLDERDIGGDGMIGLDALVEQRLMLDFERRAITIGSSAIASEVKGDGVIVVTGRLQRGQLILTEVTADRQSVDAVIDTGSELTIGNNALRDKLMRRSAESFTKIEVEGVTGKKIELDLAYVKRLKVGPIVLENVPVAFADIPPFEVFGLHQRPALLLGTDLMENFRRVSLDFKARKARFQVKDCNVKGIFMRSSRGLSRLRADRLSACS